MEDRWGAFTLRRGVPQIPFRESGYTLWPHITDFAPPTTVRQFHLIFNTPHVSSFEIEVLGHNLFLSQDPNSKHLGTTVWDSSLVFAKFMERGSKKGEFSRAKMSGKRVIELGAGCGLAGLGMALLGCDVVVTDQVAVLPILLRNVERNLTRAKYTASDNSYLGSIGKVDVAELDWGNETHVAALEPPFDYIIGTDVAYVEHLLEPLMRTILALAGPKTIIMLGYEFRSSGVREQLQELCQKHFHVKKVLHSKMDPKYQHPNIDLFILRRIQAQFLQTRSTSVSLSDTHSQRGGGTLLARETSTKSSKLSINIEAGTLEVMCQAEEGGNTQAGVQDESSSDEVGSRGTTRLDRERQTGLTSSEMEFSSVSKSRYEISSSQLGDWEVRRLGSSMARLLSEVTPPSA